MEPPGHSGPLQGPGNGPEPSGLLENRPLWDHSAGTPVAHLRARQCGPGVGRGQRGPQGPGPLLAGDTHRSADSRQVPALPGGTSRGAGGGALGPSCRRRPCGLCPAAGGILEEGQKGGGEAGGGKSTHSGALPVRLRGGIRPGTPSGAGGADRSAGFVPAAVSGPQWGKARLCGGLQGGGFREPSG